MRVDSHGYSPSVLDQIVTIGGQIKSFELAAKIYDKLTGRRISQMHIARLTHFGGRGTDREPRSRRESAACGRSEVGGSNAGVNCRRTDGWWKNYDTRFRVNAERAFLTLDAKSEKNREGNSIPLRADLAADLRSWLADRVAAQNFSTIKFSDKVERHSLDEPLFDVPEALVKILDRDLKAADIPKCDDRSRTLDVHALRHTFGTHLSLTGVSLRTAQAAMRHSDPKLTANVYCDPRLLDVHGAVESLLTFSPTDVP